MEYICSDRGTQKCPCILMGVGQCYTCSMIKTGKCDCPAGWQGVCPFTEYYQRNQRVSEESESKVMKIIGKKDYSERLKALVLETSAGFALRCKELGSFLMLNVKGFWLPLSVTQSNIEKGTGHVHLMFYVAGPKTKALADICQYEESLLIKGPFFNGLINSETFCYDKPVVVIGKGMAIMPFLNQKERLKTRMKEIYVDTEKMTEEFLRDYMKDLNYITINMADDLERMVQKVKLFAQNGYNILAMLSPYYAEKLSEISSKALIYPNHHNMCCGMGLCGACSYTDEKGITVRGCKCNMKKEA